MRTDAFPSSHLPPGIATSGNFSSDAHALTGSSSCDDLTDVGAVLLERVRRR